MIELRGCDLYLIDLTRIGTDLGCDRCVRLGEPGVEVLLHLRKGELRKRVLLGERGVRLLAQSLLLCHVTYIEVSCLNI